MLKLPSDGVISLIPVGKNTSQIQLKNKFEVRSIPFEGDILWLFCI
jgi:hypothetical protein